jgi:phage-related minor tail protein
MKREIVTTLALDGEREYKKALSDAARQLRVLGSELKATESAFGDNTDSVEALTAKSKILRKEIDQQEEIVKSLRKAVDEAAEKYGEADKRTDGYRIQLNNATTALNRMSSELGTTEQRIDEMERSLRDATDVTEDFETGVESAAKKVDGSGSDMEGVFGSLSSAIGGDAGKIIGSLGGIGDKIKGLIGETDGAAGSMNLAWGGVATAALGVVAAIVQIGKEVIAQARQVRISAAEMKAALGLTEAEASALKETAQSLYARGFTESVSEAMEALTVTKAYMRDLNNEDLKKITGQAVVLSKTFGVDLQSMMKSASTMMLTFDDSAQSTVDTITALLQVNPAESGEFLDALNEYANQFEEMGYTSQEFAGILASGMENGAFSIDKVGDALKELNIRAKDSSDTTKEALVSLGVTSEEQVDSFMRSIAEGGPSAKESIDLILAALGSLEDPLKQNEIGVALMGSQWEDVGSKVITSLDSTSSKLEDISGLAQKHTEEILEASTTQSEKTKRTMENWRTETGEHLIDGWDSFIESFTDFGVNFGSRIQEWSLDLFGLGKDSGESMVDGMIDGIRAQEGDLRAVAASTARAAADAARDELDINSPSGVFREIGRYSGMGWGAGFSDELRDVERQARSAMAQLVPSVSLPGISQMPQTVMHSGTIRVEGVNDRGQLIDIIEMKIKNDLQLEMRAL